MRKICWIRSDGGMNITTPASDDVFDRVLAEIQSVATSIMVVNDTDIPKDRTYRDAWSIDFVGKSISIDQTKKALIDQAHSSAAKVP